ncbi:MAG TPA: electron transfer flavoprotein subunit alpha/FixB family protein, partial [Bacteroidota bacterium]|nr:electron transfer flavoprotein subunit alpha/FixB family protein [Bacteroidota bacterium]
MKVLAFAEQRDGKFRKSSFETVQAARRIADQLGAECLALVVGSGVEPIATELSSFGAQRVLVVDDPALAQHANAAYAHAIAEVAKKEEASIVFLPASQMGKDIAPRVAVKLNAGLASDCTALKVESGDIIATRPVYAGKALLDVRVTTPVKMFTLRPNVFTASPAQGTCTVQKVSVAFQPEHFITKVREVKVAVGRPDVTEANIIVSGGRGMKGPENWHLI